MARREKIGLGDEPGTHLKEQHRHTAAVCSVYWGPAQSITSYETREATTREAAATLEPEPLGHARPNRLILTSLVRPERISSPITSRPAVTLSALLMIVSVHRWRSETCPYQISASSKRVGLPIGPTCDYFRRNPRSPL